MLNRPFSATNFNVIDERSCNAVPTNICGQNVLVTQDQHRRIFDTLITSIAGCGGHQTFQPHCYYSGPNSVTFTFRGNSPCPAYPTQPQFTQWQCQQPVTSCPQMSLNELQNSMNLLQLQHQFKSQPYQLKLHLDGHTSTTDLPLASNTNEDQCRESITDEVLRDRMGGGSGGKKVDFQEPCCEKKKKTTVTTEQVGKHKRTQVHFCCDCCDHESDYFENVIEKPFTKKKAHKTYEEHRESDISENEEYNIEEGAEEKTKSKAAVKEKKKKKKIFSSKSSRSSEDSSDNTSDKI